MQHMTIWDVIADPGSAIAPLTDADCYVPIEYMPVRRFRPRSPQLFDVYADLFPIMQAPVVAKEVPTSLSVGKEPPAPKLPKVKTSLIRPPAAEVAYVQAAIAAILPRGVPTYVKEIIYVGRVPRSKHGRRVELVLWDGGIGRLDISGEPGAHGYHWKATGGDGRPFHWDKAAGGWTRVDEPEV